MRVVQQWFFLLCGFCMGCLPSQGRESRAGSGAVFAEAKTIFQTDRPYQPRMGIAVDGVIVHLHNGGMSAARDAIHVWQAEDFCVGRMFFADSDGANEYWNGKWDGADHSGDIEQKAHGEQIICAGVRPYMVPTAGWIRYLQELTEQSLQAGAVAILPEEPLAHAYAGYSESFKQLWAQHYGFPWQAQDSSALARFLTAQLKSKLYFDLEEKLLQTTRAYTGKAGTDASFIIPIHSIYGNIAGQLIAPLGHSVSLDDVDGCIGQIWTGPVNWALNQYSSDDKSFFGSAYALYDYFTQLTIGTDKKLWLLVDPVEDNPNHTWSEFSEWYQHCVAAMLLMPEVDSYEVMPWPDRIFLPGFDMGGGTPAPQDFRKTVLAITQALQEMPLGGQWRLMASEEISSGIAVAIADTAMWQNWTPNKLQGIYGQLMPLIERGVPVSACVLERAADESYMSSHKVIVVSYEDFKPVSEEMNTALAAWVRRGGVLVLLGNSNDDLDRSDTFWWQQLGFASPMHHLVNELGGTGPGSWRVGSGYVMRDETSPSAFADTNTASQVYLPLIDWAVQHSAAGHRLATPGYFMMRRGPFVIANARQKPVSAGGKFIDIFDPDLPVVDGIHLAQGASGLFRDVTDILAGGGPPVVLHATHRLMSQQSDAASLQFVVKGPAETPAVVRIFTGGRQIASMTAVDSSGKTVEVTSAADGDTIRLAFPNDPGGVKVAIR